MINRIKKMFAGEATEGNSSESPEKLSLATAALLVEAACMDGNFDDDERRSITGLLQSKFELNIEETETLIAEAELAVEETGQLFAFTRVIKDRFEPDERIQMIEMLWEVAFADGNVDHFESNLIRRVAGLIYVEDKERGIAKQRVMARLGIND